MPNNILVTGANGFIGTHMVNHLTKQDDVDLVVAAIRDLRADHWTSTALSDAVQVRLDLNEPSTLRRLKRIISFYEINQIYHFACQAIVSRAKKNPLDTYSTNIMGTAKVLEAARYIGGTKILHMSTDKVYGEGLLADKRDYGLYSEPYSSSKFCAEWIVEDYRRTFDMNITVTRPCNTIGYDRYNLTRIVPSFITKLLSGEKPIVYDTKSLRQYIYIDDVVKILQQSMGKGRTINIGSPNILTPLNLGREICAIMDKKEQYDLVPADFKEIKQQSMGHDPRIKYTPLAEALRKTIDLFKQFQWGSR